MKFTEGAGLPVVEILDEQLIQNVLFRLPRVPSRTMHHRDQRANESRHLLRCPSFPFDQILRFSLERKVARDLLLDGRRAGRCECCFNEQTTTRHSLVKALLISSQ